MISNKSLASYIPQTFPIIKKKTKSGNVGEKKKPFGEFIEESFSLIKFFKYEKPKAHSIDDRKGNRTLL